MQISYTLSDIDAIVKEILQQAGSMKCYAFYAPMGAGKTTLINAMCSALEVVDNVSSPTYSLINEYRTKSGELVVHMDWYRLKDDTDALNAGVEDYIQGANYCLIEWPERAESLLPANTISVKIEVLDDRTRKIELIV